MDIEVAWATIAAIGVVIQIVVETLRNSFDKEAKLPSVVWNGAALAVGIIAALIWHLNAITVTGSSSAASATSGVLGQVLTGIAAAGASNGLHKGLKAAASYSRSKDGARRT